MIADDPTTPGDIAPRQVLDTYVRHTNELFDLYVDGEVISTTGEHPFWVPDQGWVKAKDLQIGTRLQTEDGKIIDVDGVSRREGDFTVYNLKVDDFHTYYVSDLEILVHNANYAPIYDPAQGFSTVPNPDPAADALAKKIGGVPRVRFNSDPNGREFDAVSDQFIAQAKPALQTVGSPFRYQAQATFEAAKQSGRGVYYEFDGQPAQQVINKLNEYAGRYQVPLTIDIK